MVDQSQTIKGIKAILMIKELLQILISLMFKRMEIA